MSKAFRKVAYEYIQAKKAYKLMPKRDPVVWKPELFDGLRRSEHVIKALQSGPKTRKQIWEAIKDTKCGMPSVKKLSKILAALIKDSRIRAKINVGISNKHFVYLLKKRNGKNNYAFENIKAGKQIGPKVTFLQILQVTQQEMGGAIATKTRTVSFFPHSSTKW